METQGPGVVGLDAGPIGRFKATAIRASLLTPTTIHITPSVKVVICVRSQSSIFFFMFGGRSRETNEVRLQNDVIMRLHEQSAISRRLYK